ncbi:MAG: NAD-dependent epimerase/dehydratase family protein [Actinomycetota bacterium]|nr:NAD(P)-dependent oxidoreductase [Actinomycetota bacterium]
MRIFLAGASGVIGRPLVPALVREGHRVSALTRKPEKVDLLESLGAEPVVCDVYDADRLRDLVVAARPDIVIQHLTDLPRDLGPRNVKQAYARNDRVRGEGSTNLVAAAEAAGTRRYIAQTVCFLYARVGPWVVDEEHPLATDAPEPFGSSVRLHAEMERRVVENPRFEGLVLRYGFWYGPGTSFASDGFTAREVRRRRYPIVGDGAGTQSFVHMDDVVESTIAAMTHGRPGVYNVCDDEPAPVREWLPAYARALGAPPPRRVPVWIARMLAGRFIGAQATTMRGASNERAKRELGWKPKYASWREGFRTALG